MKTVLYGGSFDPVHNGHKHIVEKLSERFERVIIMPTAVSPFKREGAVASSDRINMLELAEFAPNVSISQYETSKEGVSYTADTLEYLSSRLGNDITVAMGCEELQRLSQWRKAEYIKNFGIYVIPRPGFDCDRNIKSLESEGFHIIKADFKGPDVSSSMIKVDIAFGFTPQMPIKSFEYAAQHGLYCDYNVYTHKFEYFRMDKERIAHTYRTVKCGIVLAKRYGANVNKVIIALILHDIGKNTDREFLRSIGIKVADDVESLPQPLRHAYYGEAIARDYFGISDEDILGAIRNHTTGSPDMGLYGEIASLADFIEEGRSFEGVDEIRLAARTSLKRAVLMMLKNTVDYLTASGKEIGGETLAAYEFYKKNYGE